MTSKRHHKIYILIAIILLILISVFTYDNLLGESKEVRSAKNFMKKLEDIYAINLNDNINNMKFEVLPIKGSVDKNVSYTVVTQNYGVDLNNDYEIIGFSKKEAKHGTHINITEQESIGIAEKYVSEILNESLVYKEVRDLEGQNLPYYNICFYKKKDDYIFLDREVILQIDKYTGELDGYTNSFNDEKDEYISTIIVQEDEAKQNIVDYFKKLHMKVTECNKVEFGYLNIDKNKNVLAYVFEVNVINESKEENYKIKVNAYNGEIINTIK